MKTALADRHIRTNDFAERIEGVEFAPEVWAVFARLHQPHTAAELAAQLNLDIEAVQAALRRLVRRKLARRHVLGWHDYAATTPTPVVAAPTPAAPARPVLNVTIKHPPATVAAPPPAPEPVAAPAPVEQQPAISFRIASGRPPQAAPAPVVNLRIASRGAAVPPPAKPPACARWRLRPVLDAIGAKAGGGLAGQLLVYRVFLQVPTELMHAGGLHSLSLVDEHFTVAHAPLRTAIVEAARKHADVEVAPLLAA
jgi:hypothetical protein